MLTEIANPRQETSSEFTAFERAMEGTAKHRSRLGAFIAQWEVLLTIYRHNVEIPRLIEAPVAVSESQHRVMLTGLLTMSETIWQQVESQDESAMDDTGYSKEFVSANLSYVREKYLAWFGERDAASIAKDEKIILDALSKAA